MNYMLTTACETQPDTIIPRSYRREFKSRALQHATIARYSVRPPFSYRYLADRVLADATRRGRRYRNLHECE